MSSLYILELLSNCDLYFSLAKIFPMSYFSPLTTISFVIEIERGLLAPLGLMCPSVMAWVISHRPSPRLAGLALSWA